MPDPRPTLAIDVGGTGLKASVLDAEGKMLHDRVRVKTPYPCPPKVLVDALVGLVDGLPDYGRISVGFPGVVRGGTVVTAPHFGNEVWAGFDLAGALKARLDRPTRILNDADMQGLAAVKGEGLEMVDHPGHRLRLGALPGRRAHAPPRARPPPGPQEARPTTTTSATTPGRRRATRSGTTGWRRSFGSSGAW